MQLEIFRNQFVWLDIVWWRISHKSDLKEIWLFLRSGSGKNQTAEHEHRLVFASFSRIVSFYAVVAISQKTCRNTRLLWFATARANGISWISFADGTTPIYQTKVCKSRPVDPSFSRAKGRAILRASAFEWIWINDIVIVYLLKSFIFNDVKKLC